MGKVTSQIMSKDMIDSKNKANVDPGFIECKELGLLKPFEIAVFIICSFELRNCKCSNCTSKIFVVALQEQAN
jgi:hypothetical protein